MDILCRKMGRFYPSEFSFVVIKKAQLRLRFFVYDKVILKNALHIGLINLPNDKIRNAPVFKNYAPIPEISVGIVSNKVK